VRVYFAVLVLSTVLVTVLTHSTVYPDWGNALRYAAFQVVSVGTSAGFAKADSTVWTASSHIILIFLTLICASSGSTSGGIKIDRFILFWKLVRLKVKRTIHPNIVDTVRIDGRAMNPDHARDAMLFVVFYLVIVSASSLALTVTGVNFLEAFTGSAACMGNVGPGLGAVGSMGNYAGLPGLSKLILCLVMVVGRLEIFVFILPFTRGFWKK